jgi:hypothetical protein
MLENRLYTIHFIKRPLRYWSLEFMTLGPSFRKVGPGIFCTTMHRLILRVLSPSFRRNEVSPCYSVHPSLLIYRWLIFLFPKLKIPLKGRYSRLLHGSNRLGREQWRRYEKKSFPGHSMSFMSDVNVVVKQAGICWVMVLINNCYILCFMAWVLELNCHTVWISFSGSSVSIATCSKSRQLIEHVNGNRTNTMWMLTVYDFFPLHNICEANT